MNSYTMAYRRAANRTPACLRQDRRNGLLTSLDWQILGVACEVLYEGTKCGPDRVTSSSNRSNCLADLSSGPRKNALWLSWSLFRLTSAVRYAYVGEIEWAYRLCREPKRMWRRNVNSFTFLARVLHQCMQANNHRQVEA